VKMGKFWTALMVPLLWRYLDFLCFYFLIKLDGAFCFFFFFLDILFFCCFSARWLAFTKDPKLVSYNYWQCLLFRSSVRHVTVTSSASIAFVFGVWE
jgi:hypothetical protein